ncbi:membrane protein [Kitasatospora kazusensis]|uniref:Membrane protein n=1 Tax=Kitasatospora kazusensis TaxID=407974 RepID=A0ABP5KQE6_9ACTN
MTNTPHLPAEDRPDYERALDEALRDRSILDALRASGPHLNAEQLHTKALLAADEIAAAAAAEYEHYAGLRAALRPADPAGPAGPPGSAGGLSARLRSEEGAGFFPVLTALTPILAWAAAAVLLLIGYLLRAGSPALALGKALVTAGWVLVGVGAAALVVGIVGLLLTALRDGSATPYGQDPQLRADLAEARRAWLTALRERAILPYLYANLESAPAHAPVPGARPNPPDFTSPGYSPAHFSSPGFTSPGGDDPVHGHRTAEFSSPGYSPPDFTGPDEV